MSASERRIEALEAALDRERRISEELERELDKTRHLLTAQLRGGLELEFEGIVSGGSGEPHVHLRWDQLAAQVSPARAREMGFSLIRVAEWADVDSTIYRALRRDFDERTAGGMMALLRRARGQEPEWAAKSAAE